MTPVLGWSTLGLPPLTDDRTTGAALDAVFAAGFGLLEVHLTEPLPRPFGPGPLLPAPARAHVRAVGRAVAARGGTIVLGLGGRRLLSDERHRPTLFDADDEGRGLRRRLVAEAVELAADAGAPLLVVLSGPASHEDVSAGDKHGTPAWARLVESLDGLVARAGAAGVVLAPEAHSRHLLATIADYEALRDALGRPRSLALTADTAHQTIAESVALADLYAEHARLLGHVQVDNLRSVPAPGAPLDHAAVTEPGAVDIAGAFTGLDRGRYGGAVAVEFLAEDHPEVDALAYCAAAGAALRALAGGPGAR